MEQEIAWLKRDKYKMCDIQSRTNKNRFLDDVKRLQAGEPLDYVIGWKEFLGCKIDLSSRPLIPREETEFWVGEVLRDRFSCNKMGSRKTKTACEVAFSSTKNDFSRPLRVLDLFSGSGCIGLAIQKHFPKAKVTFADLYPMNRKTIKTDIFSNIKGKFDIIFANPPYVPINKSKVQKSVKDWEPKEALYAGPDGLAIIRKFLKQAGSYLNIGGRIYLEFGYGQKAKIEKLIKQFGYGHYQFRKDQFGKWRSVVVELTHEKTRSKK